jgi:hypothetical protein
MFHVKHRRAGSAGTANTRFCKTTLWIKKSALFYKGLSITGSCSGVLGAVAARHESEGNARGSEGV